MISKNKPIFTEPKCLVTGVEGAGKTLFAIQQADLLTKEEGGELYQLNIREADPHHLPVLPFKLDEMAFNEDGTPVIDPETGDHLPRWATLPAGSVIVVDEAHKVYPQRGPGRPPKHIEMLAEGRQFGIRFIFLTQSPASLDSFIRERISRHYHLERKGNMSRATVFEFDTCITFPRNAWRERKDAAIHMWSYPKEYYGWYKSAKSHHFKLRIPWKIWAALLFIPLAGWVAWSVISKVGNLAEAGGGLVAPAEASAGGIAGGGLPRERGPSMTTDAAAYIQQFAPIVETQPWSAPAYQGREVVAKPVAYCMAAAGGIGADGSYREAGCTCLTEQGTPYGVATGVCESLARTGMYNPFLEPTESASRAGEQGKPESARTGRVGVLAPPPIAGDMERVGSGVDLAPGASTAAQVLL